MRTYSRAAWDEAQERWLDFSPEWRTVRHQAAMRGMLFPPDGTALDSWDAAEPSQRAILVRAIRETPKLLERAVATSRTWGDVVHKVLYEVNAARSLSVEEDDRDRKRRADEPSHVEAAQSLAGILERLEASR